MCTSGQAINRAGANVSSAVISGAILNSYSDNAEGRICAETHYDFITNFTTRDTGIQYSLQDVSSAMIAMDMVAYDMSGYMDRREAETILDVLDERVNKGLIILKNKSNQKLGVA